MLAKFLILLGILIIVTIALYIAWPIPWGGW